MNDQKWWLVSKAMPEAASTISGHRLASISKACEVAKTQPLAPEISAETIRDHAKTRSKLMLHWLRTTARWTGSSRWLHPAGKVRDARALESND